MVMRGGVWYKVREGGHEGGVWYEVKEGGGHDGRGVV